jgi:hypothetical protein
MSTTDTKAEEDGNKVNKRKSFTEKTDLLTKDSAMMRGGQGGLGGQK